MSTLWTPEGDRPVGTPPESPPVDEALSAKEYEAMDERVSQLRDQLADAPVEVVVANHCLGFFELAALHLSLKPPRLREAQLAIDALGALVEGLAGRLGDDEQHLREGLTQVRMAYVQIKTASQGAPPPPA